MFNLFGYCKCKAESPIPKKPNTRFSIVFNYEYMKYEVFQGRTNNPEDYIMGSYYFDSLEEANKFLVRIIEHKYSFRYEPGKPIRGATPVNIKIELG